MNIWNTLQIEATDDVGKIKKAYAQLIKQYNPEEHMQEFLEIRSAYRQALALASQETVGGSAAAVKEPSDGMEPISPEPEAIQLPLLHDFVYRDAGEADRYVDCEAMKQLRCLYFEKQCSDKNLWIRYFVSEAFLDVFREAGFTAQLKAELMKQEGKPNKAFFTLLPIVYGLKRGNSQDIVAHGIAGNVSFEGIQSINELLETVNVSVNMNDNTNIALSKGYEDYRGLCSLTQAGVWNDSIAHSLSNLVSRYVIAYIYDKIPQDRRALYQMDYIPRHISALQLLNHYFAKAALPRQAYGILWDKLDLKNAKMGRNKVLYGRLREICLEKYPDLERAEKESFGQFRMEATRFFVSMSKNSAEFAMEAAEEFFRREDLKRALRNQSFVEEDVLRIWTAYRKQPIFLHCLIEHCIADEQVVLREELISRARQTLHTIRVEEALKEDEGAALWEQPLSIENRAFFRYLFYVAFPNAHSFRHVAALREVMQYDFPYSSSIGEGLLGYDHGTDDFSTPRTLTVRLGPSRLDIFFRLRYVAYCLEDKPVYAPFLEFKEVGQLEDDLLFWVLLPLTFAALEQRETVWEEIMRRLGKLVYLEGASLELFAHCIADSICTDIQEEYIPPVLTINRERFGILYTCLIYTSDLFIQVYKTAENQQRTLLLEEVGSDLQNALQLGEGRLDVAVNLFDGENLNLPQLPLQIQANTMLSQLPSCTEEGTLDAVKYQLLRFRDKKLQRLELSWGDRKIVLLAADNRYVCFGFDDGVGYRFTYLSRPDIYRTVESKDVQYERFLYGKLPTYLLHSSPHSILCSINDIMDYIANGRYLSSHGRMDWAQEVYQYKKHQYAIDRCLLAGFPIVPPDLPLFEGFVLSHMPAGIRTTTPEGEVTEIQITPANRLLVSESLMGYLRGSLTGLVLIWSLPQPNDAHFQRRLELLGGDGYAMLYSHSGSEQIQILVADVRAYLNHKGNKYHMQALGSYKIPDYMVHRDLYRIRGYLNVLLATITDPDQVLGISWQFAYLPKAKGAKGSEPWPEQ